MLKPKSYLVIAVLSILALAAGACVQSPPTPTPSPSPAPAPSPSPSPPPKPSPATTITPGEANFRFLISDDVNAIEDFEHLYVTITSIGVHQGGESGKWLQFSPDVPTIDLKPLVGENAQEIWDGNVPPGEYTKVFIYVSEVSGFLVGGKKVEVRLPSSKLQISKPFSVTENSMTSFVYDVTVVAAGNEKSGIKYILKPQIAESGADKKFKEVKASQEQERERNELQLRIEGDAQPGAKVDLTVTSDGSPVEGAKVTVNNKDTGSTSADGKLGITLPENTDKVVIKATSGNKKGELELEFGKEAEEEKLKGTIGSIVV